MSGIGILRRGEGRIPAPDDRHPSHLNEVAITQPGVGRFSGLRREPIPNIQPRRGCIIAVIGFNLSG